MLFFARPPPTPPPPPPPVASGFAAALIFCGAAACVTAALRNTPAPGKGGLGLQIGGLIVSVVSVALPGRFDSDADVLVRSPWPTLFNPAGFAFAIWGVIYLGEAAGVLALAVNREAARAAAPAAPAWLSANCAQALWCAAFRPWALSRLWLSSACLAATAACLVVSQRTAAPALRGPLGALVSVPRSLHAGWVTAAALVNVNAWAGSASLGAARCFAAAVLSLLAAAALADSYARLGLLSAAAAVGWALFAVSRGAAVGPDAAALGPLALDGLATASAAVAAAVAVSIAVRGAQHLRTTPTLADMVEE
mmetsp:Transcript_15434/g.49693  ORF Transcript_15434/g.49693 Transcript_15434/m.49693 type:complete len:309 (-) Transcript_15434:168-1094(-)